MICWASFLIYVCSIWSGVHVLITLLRVDIGIPGLVLGERRGAGTLVRNKSWCILLEDLEYLRFGHTLVAVSRIWLATLCHTCGGDVKFYNMDEGI